MVKKREIYNSPIIRDNKVKFVYKNDNAEKVKIVGNWLNWQPEIELFKNGDSLWTSNIIEFSNNRRYEYKFLINDNIYITDPVNFQRGKNETGEISLLFVWENPKDFEKNLERINNELLQFSPQSHQFKRRDDILRELDYYFQQPTINRSVLLNQFFEKRINIALSEIEEVKIKDGIRIWHLYNDGFIVKTPQTIFGIDVVSTRCIWGLGWEISDDTLNKITDLLDFLLITHPHSDHSDEEIVQLMLDKNKLVFVSPENAVLYDKRISSFTYNKRFEIKKQTIIPYKGTHVYDNGRNINIAYYQVWTDTGINILHTGDHDFTKSLNYEKEIDCLITRLTGVNNEFSMTYFFSLFSKYEPKLLLPGHIIELAHYPGGGRGSYSQILDNIKAYNLFLVLLMWGESYHIIL